MEAIVSYAVDGFPVDGWDDEGALLTDVGREGLNRVIGMVGDRRQRRPTALSSIARRATDRVSAQRGKLDEGASVCIFCNDGSDPEYELRDDVTVGPAAGLDEFMTLLPNQSETKFG